MKGANLKLQKKQAEIQSDNAKTQHEIASANLENAQALKVRAEAYVLMIDMIEKHTLDFGLTEMLNNNPCFEQRLNTLIEDLLNRN